VSIATRLGIVVVAAIALVGSLTNHTMPSGTSAVPSGTPLDRSGVVEEVHRRTSAAARSSTAVAQIPRVSGLISRKVPRSSSNWVLVKATSARVTRITSPFAVWGRRTGQGPLVLGIGMAVEGTYPFSWVSVERLSGGSPTVAFTAGPARQVIRFTVLENRGGFSFAPVSIQDDATLVAVMVFVVNGVIDGVDWAPRGEDASVASSTRWGTGAAALEVRAPTSGAGVVVAGAGAGAGSYARTVPKGIAGAFEWMSCQSCVGRWTPPGGEAHPWVNVRHQAWPVCWCGSVVGLGTVFAGRAGRWNWTWTGVSASDHGGVLTDGAGMLLAEPVLAAYAPIGADWVLFEPCKLSVQCLE
jgi:hypothetical protein